MKSVITLLLGVGIGALSAAPALSQAPAAAARASASAKVTAGAKVLDAKGGDVGTVESVSGDVAVVFTGTNRVGVPVASFGSGPNGLLLAMTKAELDQAAAGAQAQQAANVTAGAAVNDTKGGVVGKIDSVEGEFAVVDTGKTKAKLPVSAFSAIEGGLVIAMTAAEIEAAAQASAPSATN